MFNVNLIYIKVNIKDSEVACLTSDEIFHLISRDIRQLQGDGNSCSRCPVTINLLHMLKTQPSGSALYIYSPGTMFTIGCLLFGLFSSMRVVEFTSPSSSNSFSPQGLHWSDVELLNFCPLLSHLHYVSQKHSFKKSQCITITATNTYIYLPSVCPALLCLCYTTGQLIWPTIQWCYTPFLEYK